MDDKKYTHIPVLFNEAINGLNIKPDGIYIDCTLGGGGHSNAILSRLTTGKLISFDQDAYAINRIKNDIRFMKPNFTIIQDNFVNIKQRLLEINIKKVDGIIFDLGVSSFQLDQPDRGFSYHNDGRLDMRMDNEASLDAEYVVNNYSEEELTRIFFEYGEEKFSRLIAKKIVKYREDNHISTTSELVEIIKKSLPAFALRNSGHPAKRVFQAIRIEVNKELNVFKLALNDCFDLLNKNGRICVISFHSLEDRICKQMFKEKTSLNLPNGMPYIPEGYEVKFSLVNKKAIIPSEEELINNPRSHSAKLRIIERIAS